MGGKLVINHEQVMAVIPHRPPMLLVDIAKDLIPDESCSTELWIDPEREIFKGHFPDDPALPGVHTAEAMA